LFYYYLVEATSPVAHLPPQTAKSAQKPVLHLQKLQKFVNLINLYLSDKPIPTTTTLTTFPLSDCHFYDICDIKGMQMLLY